MNTPRTLAVCPNPDDMADPITALAVLDLCTRLERELNRCRLIAARWIDRKAGDAYDGGNCEAEARYERLADALRALKQPTPEELP